MMEGPGADSEEKHEPVSDIDTAVVVVGLKALDPEWPIREASGCRLLAVRPEGANHQWRKIPPRELSIDLVADERLGRVTGRAGAS